MRRTLVLSACALVLSSTAAAQQVLATSYGTAPNGGLGTVVRAAGDVDGDGVGDFAVSEPNATQGRVRLVSGASRATLATFVAAAGNGFGTHDVNPIGDVDGDGRVDFAVGYSSPGPLEVFSGASGARLYTIGAPFQYYGYACSVGDYDGDGRDDFAAMVYANSSVQIWVLRGLTGAQLGILTASSQSDGFLRNVGDLTGDGRPEIAAFGRLTAVYDLHPIRLLRSINLNGVVSGPLRSVAAADMDGDGRQDLLLGFNSGQHLPFLTLVSATTGTVLRSLSLPPDDGTSPSGSFGVLSDIDGDGVPDVVAEAFYDPMSISPGYGVMALLSGADGHRIGAWSGSPQFACSGVAVAGIGDANADGFSDFVLGNASAQAGNGGWQLISSRGLGSMLSKPVNCSSGPFAPQLGVSRPLLGQSMTVAGRDAPAGALAVVALSLMPADRTNLGVVGCDVWIDLSNWSVIGMPASSPAWQFGLPLPSARSLVGLEVALQTVYAGTATAIGADLSNAVWARLGY